MSVLYLLFHMEPFYAWRWFCLHITTSDLRSGSCKSTNCIYCYGANLSSSKFQSVDYYDIDIKEKLHKSITIFQKLFVQLFAKAG